MGALPGQGIEGGANGTDWPSLTAANGRIDNIIFARSNIGDAGLVREPTWEPT
jgi:hypothetical protein